MATRKSSGRPSTSREREITSRMRASGSLARCERPTSAPSNAASDQPGRLEQGPEEKFGLSGRISGLAGVFMTRFRLRGGADTSTAIGAVNARADISD